MTKQPFEPVIMQIIPNLGAGGAEQGCIDVAQEIVTAGAKAIVVSNGGYRVPELARFGAQHIQLPVHSKNPLVIWQNTKRLIRLIKKHKVNIVHVRSRAPAWSALKACKKTGVPYVTTCHAPYNITGEAKRKYNSAIAQGDVVIAISQYVAKYLKENYGVEDSRIRTIPRGIPLEKFHPTTVTPERLITLSREWRIPDGANIIMLPGRLTRWKGHLVLIDAIEKLQRQDVFCVLIGSDQGRTEYRKELEDKIAEKNLGGKIRIVDHCHDMPAAYMLSTVIVSASTDPEGFGRVPVEAQAMGRPIVATDHGGAQETILRGQTGWLIPPHDSTSMAQAIDDALSLNPTQRAVLATRSMSHVAANFTRDMMVNKTLEVYAELLHDNFKSKSKTEPFEEHIREQKNAPEEYSSRKKNYA